MFDVLLVGVAAALRIAVAAMKGVLARGEKSGGTHGEEFVRTGPERPIDATLRAERARHGLFAADYRGAEETAKDKRGPLSCREGIAEFGAASEPERAVTEASEEGCPFLHQGVRLRVRSVASSRALGASACRTRETLAVRRESNVTPSSLVGHMESARIADTSEKSLAMSAVEQSTGRTAAYCGHT